MTDDKYILNLLSIARKLPTVISNDGDTELTLTPDETVSLTVLLSEKVEEALGGGR